MTKQERFARAMDLASRVQRARISIYLRLTDNAYVRSLMERS